MLANFTRKKKIWRSSTPRNCYAETSQAVPLGSEESSNGRSSLTTVGFWRIERSNTWGDPNSRVWGWVGSRSHSRPFVPLYQNSSMSEFGQGHYLEVGKSLSSAPHHASETMLGAVS